MKTLKIILCIIAVVAVFFCGVAYQSYSNHTDEYVESKDTVETTKTQEEIDRDNEKFYEEYEKERLALKEAIKEDDPEYQTAQRLIELLRFVLPIPSESVPKTSILREFIGGSYFE